MRGSEKEEEWWCRNMASWNPLEEVQLRGLDELVKYI
jgi:hypothetical protein